MPVNGGMINNNTKVGFDAQNRPIVAYHKFDTAGNTQLYNARFEGGRWVTHKTSSWTTRWAFSGQGTLVFEIQVEPAKVDAAGTLTQRWYHAQQRRLGRVRARSDDAGVDRDARPLAPLPGLAGDRAVDDRRHGRALGGRLGRRPRRDVLYMLRWETLDSNRDMPRSPSRPRRACGCTAS